MKIVEEHKQHFGSVEMTVRPVNLGLAENIVDAVSRVLLVHEKVIVLEDDIVVSSHFLRYMNDALDHYQEEKKVWHIASHTEVNKQDRANETFLWRMMNCWGWATWRDRWAYFEKSPDSLIKSFSREQIKEFDLDHFGLFWSQVLANRDGRMNTWAIFWYATIFKNGGLCLNPWFGYARNIGLDGTGVHCEKEDGPGTHQPLNDAGGFSPAKSLKEDEDALSILISHYKKKGALSLPQGVKRLVRSLLVWKQ